MSTTESPRATELAAFYTENHQHVTCASPHSDADDVAAFAARVAGR